MMGKKFIFLLWDLSLEIWKGRNTEIHSNTKEDQARMAKDRLCVQVNQLHYKYKADPFFIPRNQLYLFERKSLEDCIKGTRDQFTRWISSVDNAVKAQAIFLWQQHLNSIRHYCTPRPALFANGCSLPLK
jgi:hypothetical protein